MTDLEAAAATAQAVFEAHLPGAKKFGPIAEKGGRVEVTVLVEARGARVAPFNLMSDKWPSDGSEAETQELTLAVIGAANVSGRMAGKFVYVRQYDIGVNSYMARVSLHLTSDVVFV